MEVELAIYEDCLCLIDSFAENESVNFKTFCEQWKSMSFQHIYSAQTSVVEIIQTTKTILHLTKRIVCAKDELGKVTSKCNDNKQTPRRIGGFYLMYTIYFKQPTKQYVKLLVNPETWQDFLDFIENLPPNNTSDEVKYMFWQLYKNDAFRFTALDYEIGLEDLIDYDRLYDTHKGTKTNEVVRVKLKQKLMSINQAEQNLPEMITLEDKYNETKVNCSEIIKELPETKIFHDIQDALNKIRNILNEGHIGELSRNISSLDQKRKELKRKASGMCNNTENSTELLTEEISPYDESKKYYGRLTVRQMMSQKLPQEVLDDLENSSSEENTDLNEASEFEDDVESEDHDNFDKVGI